MMSHEALVEVPGRSRGWFPGVQRGFGRGYNGGGARPSLRQAGIQSVQPDLLLARRRRHKRRGVAVLEIPAAVGDVVEVSEESIKILLRDGIVFVVVTAGAAH